MRSNKTLKYFSSFINSVSELSGREKRVLLKRLTNHTHIFIGQKWKVSEGRIRQIEQEAVNKVSSKTHQLDLFK